MNSSSLTDLEVGVD